MVNQMLVIENWKERGGAGGGSAGGSGSFFSAHDPPKHASVNPPTTFLREIPAREQKKSPIPSPCQLYEQRQHLDLHLSKRHKASNLDDLDSSP